MTTDRAHAAEEEYFRNQEEERRRDDALELQQTARLAQTDREDSEARRARQATRDAAITPNARRDTRRGLNRLIVAGWGEMVALEEAIRIVPGPDQQGNLRQKLERRRLFRGDVSAAVVALGGVPAKRASLRARGLAWGRGLRRLLIGAHGGDAYAACAHAADRATSEYSRVLRFGLPSDVRFGIERQYAEVELDCRELHRLRWGA
jgi:hypothetical protein